MRAKLQNYLLEKKTESRKTRAYKVIRYNILDKGLVSLLLWITKTEVLRRLLWVPIVITERDKENERYLSHSLIIKF